MCGINGIFHFQSAARVNPASLTAMRDAMVHRGPDGGEIWISPEGLTGLGHRRLSIIDLSTAATQPMPNEDGTIRVTFNGEIYNHVGLRQALIAAGHQFRTHHSDTEVLVHGYEEWGLEGLLSRLEGDFAIGLWDEGSRTLSLVRDRIGVKPLYFAFHEGTLLFGSEIKAILAYPGFSRDIEPIAMYHYLSFLATPAPLTMFKGVFKLPAGHYLQVSAGGEVRAVRYWDAVPGQGIPAGELEGLSEAAVEDYYVRGIRSRLTSAVEKRMVSDVPFGVFLSGGVDSSTNVALMSQLMDRPVDTFTVGFKDHRHLNELDQAQLIADRFKTRHHEILIDEQDMKGYLGDLIHHQDEPLADWVCIPLYFISKLTRDSGTVVIQVGEGSDEQFCGYASYMKYLELYERYWTPFRKLPALARNGVAGLAKLAARQRPGLEIYADVIDRAARDREVFWSGATTFYDMIKDRVVRPGAIQASTMPPELTATGLLPESYLQPDTFNVIRSFLGPFDQAHPGQDVLTRMIYSEFKLRLPELLLMRVDKITMSTSLEARVPFLDHKLVEFSMDIPMPWKIRGGEPKYLLKKAVEGLIPDEIIYRKKMGFGAPMAQWLQGDFGAQVERTLLGSAIHGRGFFDRDTIRGMIGDHRSGRRDYSQYVWALYNLMAWYDYWIAADTRAAA